MSIMINGVTRKRQCENCPTVTEKAKQMTSINMLQASTGRWKRVSEYGLTFHQHT